MADTRSAAGEGSEPQAPGRVQPAQELANLISNSDAKGKGFWRRRRRKSQPEPAAPPAPEPAAPPAPAAEPEKAQSGAEAAGQGMGAAAVEESPAETSVGAEAQPEAAGVAGGSESDRAAGASSDDEEKVSEAETTEAAAEGGETDEAAAGVAEEPAAEVADAADGSAEGGDVPAGERSRPTVGIVYEPDESPDGFPLEYGNIIVGLPKTSGAESDETGASDEAAADAEAAEEQERGTGDAAEETSESAPAAKAASVEAGDAESADASAAVSADDAAAEASQDRAESGVSAQTEKSEDRVQSAEEQEAGAEQSADSAEGSSESAQAGAEETVGDDVPAEDAHDGGTSADASAAVESEVGTDGSAEGASEEAAAGDGVSQASDEARAGVEVESSQEQATGGERAPVAEVEKAGEDDSEGGAAAGEADASNESGPDEGAAAAAQAAGAPAGEQDGEAAEQGAGATAGAEHGEAAEQDREALEEHVGEAAGEQDGEAAGEQVDGAAGERDGEATEQDAGATAGAEHGEAAKQDGEAAGEHDGEAAGEHDGGAAEQDGEAAGEQDGDAAGEHDGGAAEQDGDAAGQGAGGAAGAEHGEAAKQDGEAAGEQAGEAAEQDAGAAAGAEHGEAAKQDGEAVGEHDREAVGEHDGEAAGERVGEAAGERGGEAAEQDGAAAGEHDGEAAGEQVDGAAGEQDGEAAGEQGEGVVEELTADQLAERLAAEQAAMALITALMKLRGALATSRLPIDVVGADEARQQQKAMLDQLDDYILPRLVQLEAPVLAVVGGSTGAGKSTLVNTIIGKVVSEPGVLRPTTRSPVLIHHPADTDWFVGDRVLPGMARTAADSPGGMEDAGQLRLVAADTVPRGLAILDAPDIDSVVEANRDLATQLLAAADLWLFVTTAARYSDAVPWDFLQSASDRSTAVAVVLDRAPAETIDDITGHLAQMLLERGLGDSPLFSIKEIVVDSNGMLPAETVASIKDWLVDLAADAEARSAVVRRTLHGAVTAMVKTTPPFAAAVRAQADTVIELRSTVESAYDQAVKDIAKAAQDGTLLRGEVLARWQEFVGTGELLKGLQSNVGRFRDKVKATLGTKSAPPTRDLNDAVESGLESLLVEHAAAAAERAEKAWQSTAPGRQLLAAGGPELGAMSEDFAAAAGRTVREWQAFVLDLVRKEGAEKRGTARLLEYGVNGLALSLVVALFASDADIPTGADASSGVGSAVVGQRLLEAVFGDESVRGMVAKAREELDGKVHALMDAEFARYLTVLDQHPVDAEAARQLTEAARAVEDCT
ncbi:AAA family ATPase [Kribbella sp. NPDC049227]|uniref:AAA family ATPase n=1 Tax=Kribbella sp. NPDC049227 TaxID=3364113 RepID=UPI00371C6F50